MGELLRAAVDFAWFCIQLMFARAVRFGVFGGALFALADAASGHLSAARVLMGFGAGAVIGSAVACWSMLRMWRETVEGYGEPRRAMRPRPVARWEWRSGTYAQYLSCGHVDLGYVRRKRGCVPPWVAYCAVTDEESGPMMLEDARAWLAERVSAEGFEAEGFEVEETTDE